VRRLRLLRASVAIAALGATALGVALIGARQKVPALEPPARGDAAAQLPAFATEAQRRTYAAAVADGRARFRASLEGALAVAKRAGSTPDVDRLTAQLDALDAELRSPRRSGP
jgi:hypothetical protein